MKSVKEKRKKERTKKRKTRIPLKGGGNLNNTDYLASTKTKGRSEGVGKKALEKLVKSHIRRERKKNWEGAAKKNWNNEKERVERVH